MTGDMTKRPQYSLRRLAGRGLLVSPAVHFIVLGALLFGATSFAERRGEDRTLVVTENRAAALRADFRERHGRAPTEEEFKQLLDGYIDEEILFREALALGVARRSPAVRARLVNLARFLELENAAGEDEQALYSKALDLGLVSRDPVVRRQLVETARRSVRKLTPMRQPSQEELEACLARNAERFRRAPQVRMSHAFYRNEPSPEEAQDILRRLEAKRQEGHAAVTLGEPHALGSSFQMTVDSLSRRFGRAFADNVKTARLDEWQGPFRSRQGFHFVRLHALTPGRMVEPSEVESRLVHRWLEEQMDAREHATLLKLRSRYDVRVPRPEALVETREGS